MKRALSIFTTAFVLVVLSGSAWAVPWTWTDVVDPIPDVYIGPSYSFTHDITDSGFNAGTDTIYNFSLYLDLYDDRDLGYESVAVILDNWAFAGTYNASFDVELDYGFVASLMLLSDGLLNVTLYSSWGDFYFADSTLVANGDEASPVPEPATLLLLGSGLLGLAGLRRKNK